MKKISHMGQRVNRTPFSYPENKKMFRIRFEYLETRLVHLYTVD